MNTKESPSSSVSQAGTATPHAAPKSGRMGRWFRYYLIFSFLGAFVTFCYDSIQPVETNPHELTDWNSDKLLEVPLEINAANRLPLLENTRIRDVALSDDGSVIWIAGDDGLLLTSHDGGSSWIKAEIDGVVRVNVRHGPSLPPVRNAEPAKEASPSAPAPEPAAPAAPAPTPVKKAFIQPAMQRLEVGGAGVEPAILLAAAPPSEKTAPALAPAYVEPATPTAPPFLPGPSGVPQTVQAPSPAQVPPGVAQAAPVILADENPPQSVLVQGAIKPAQLDFLSICMTKGEGKGYAVAAFDTPPLDATTAGAVTSTSRAAVFATNDGGASWSLQAVFAAPPQSRIWLRAGDSLVWLAIESQPVLYCDEREYGFGSIGSLLGDGPPWYVFMPESAPSGIIAHNGLMSFESSLDKGYMIGGGDDLFSLRLWSIDKKYDDPPTATVVDSPNLSEDIEYIQTDEFGSDLRLLAGTSSAAATISDGKLRWLPDADNKKRLVKAIYAEDHRTGLGIYADEAGESVREQLLRITTDGGDSWSEPRYRHFGMRPVFSRNGKTILLHNGLDALYLLKAPDFRQICITRLQDSSMPQAAALHAARHATYFRLPSPLHVFSGLFSLGIAYWALRGVVKRNATEVATANSGSLADHFVADRPLQPGEMDTLGSRRLALGLARYIRNQNTGLPLTIAITGAWGSGKSSIMTLLAEELRQGGCRTVDFNAWHHQSEEHILAALLDSIRHQAVPPLWHPDGALFRLRLAMTRLGGSWVTALLYAMVALAGGVLVARNYDYFLVEIDLQHLLDSLGSILSSRSGVGGITGLGALIFGIQRALKSLSAFGVDPAKFLVRASVTAKLKDLKGQTSLRYQFAREFRQITTAMAGDMRMVIFIDDLDRCQPALMMQVLENVNFLTSSGQCVIVLGMDDEVVRDGIAQQLEWRIKLENDGAPVTQEAGSGYAAKWLEKLVQISVTVPRVTQESLLPLVEHAQPPARSEPAPLTGSKAPLIQRLIERLQESASALRLHRSAFLKAGFACVMLFASLYAAWKVKLNPLSTPPAQTMAPAAAVQPVTPTGAKTLPPDSLNLNSVAATGASLLSAENTLQSQDYAPSALLLPQPDPRSLVSAVPKLEPGQESGPWSLLIMLPLAATFGLASWKLIRTRLHPEIRDSQEVINAFEKWLPAMENEITTLRTMKSFLNKVRFYDMMSRPIEEGEKALQIDPEQLVAFGALSYVSPDSITDPEKKLPDRLSAFSDCQKHAQAVISLIHDKNADPRLKAHFRLLRQSWKKRVLIKPSPTPEPAIDPPQEKALASAA